MLPQGPQLAPTSVSNRMSFYQRHPVTPGTPRDATKSTAAFSQMRGRCSRGTGIGKSSPTQLRMAWSACVSHNRLDHTALSIGKRNPAWLGLLRPAPQVGTFFRTTNTDLFGITVINGLVTQPDSAADPQYRSRYTHYLVRINRSPPSRTIKNRIVCCGQIKEGRNTTSHASVKSDIGRLQNKAGQASPRLGAPVPRAIGGSIVIADQEITNPGPSTAVILSRPATAIYVSIVSA
jgi:hypothetical protein